MERKSELEKERCKDESARGEWMSREERERRWEMGKSGGREGWWRKIARE